MEIEPAEINTAGSISTEGSISKANVESEPAVLKEIPPPGYA